MDPTNPDPDPQHWRKGKITVRASMMDRPAEIACLED